jgi:ferritin-like metal-binding protein YciE
LIESETKRGVRAMPISSAQELFVHELGAIYEAERNAPELLQKAM